MRETRCDMHLELEHVVQGVVVMCTVEDPIWAKFTESFSVKVKNVDLVMRERFR
jgi:hypothetical protein